MPEEKKVTRWAWPLGLAAAAGGLGMVILRGCWHRKMSWPIRSAGMCYQVCTGCGTKRLFDENLFRAYGPYSYDLEKLSAHQRRHQIAPEVRTDVDQHRSAS